MSLNLLDASLVGVPPIAVHDDGNMPGHMACPQYLDGNGLEPGEGVLSYPRHVVCSNEPAVLSSAAYVHLILGPLSAQSDTPVRICDREYVSPTHTHTLINDVSPSVLSPNIRVADLSYHGPSGGSSDKRLRAAARSMHVSRCACARASTSEPPLRSLSFDGASAPPGQRSRPHTQLHSRVSRVVHACLLSLSHARAFLTFCLVSATSSPLPSLESLEASSPRFGSKPPCPGAQSSSSARAPRIALGHTSSTAPLACAWR